MSNRMKVKKTRKLNRQSPVKSSDIKTLYVSVIGQMELMQYMRAALRGPSRIVACNMYPVD